MLRRFALGAFIITALTAAATATAGLLEISSDVGIIRRGHKIPRIQGVLDSVDAGEPQTILILGSDRRYADIKAGTPARSDTILLVRLDPSQPATAVLSIPRDLRVEIPGRGIDKINAAYSEGGPRLTVKTIKALFRIGINHVVNVNFRGFREAVDRLGCVYVDIDRRYFNDNNPPAGGGGNYATIDIAPGYQKLCGSDALDYVRFRHLDTDLVRAARQQDFLRQAKEQIGFGNLLGSRKKLLEIFSRYADTDIRSTTASLRLLKLAVESAGHPVREVRFQAEVGPSYVDATPAQIAAVRSEFLHPAASEQTPRPKSPSRPSRERLRGIAAGVVADDRAARAYARRASLRNYFPMYYAAHRLARATAMADPPRVYRIRDRRGGRHRAYRIVMFTGELGQYYGIQGMSWTDPPILSRPSETRIVRGRRLELFFDGARLRLVAWRRPPGVYWVSNTLSETLTNRQMLDIAASLRRVGPY